MSRTLESICVAAFALALLCPAGWAACPADLDFDGQASARDWTFAFVLLYGTVDQQSGRANAGDLDDDGDVDLADFAIFQHTFGDPCRDPFLLSSGTARSTRAWRT